MKIKITACHNHSAWYSGLIGHTFDGVEPFSADLYRLRQDGFRKFFAIKDVEVVEEDAPASDSIELSVELSGPMAEQSTIMELPVARPVSISNIELDREAWLTKAARLIHDRDDLPFSVSYGFGKGGNRSRKGWSVHNDTKQLPQLFIHPDTKDGIDLLCRIASATLPHDGIEFNSAHSILEKLGKFPSNPLDSEIKKDTVRQIKCVCPSCGFTMRTSRHWIERGLPTCSCGTKIKQA